MDFRLLGEYGLRLTMLHFVFGFMIIIGMLVIYQSHTAGVKLALDECIEEVQNNCKGLYNYAVSLEEENARLNRECK